MKIGINIKKQVKFWDYELIFTLAYMSITIGMFFKT